MKSKWSLKKAGLVPFDFNDKYSIEFEFEKAQIVTTGSVVLSKGDTIKDIRKKFKELDKSLKDNFKDD